ncbi:MAG: succinate dehydrogenase, hydrophobic membrane anchor protein [Coxiella sp. RIFCSPHIGHO2_12_FULL_44_14]|nr:MAG: succinate dehydrogenase, hydrophobic membrane anchor protein [Coxiella sp. RIFCSPHIGHO2_12_FULL_44_14]
MVEHVDRRGWRDWLVQRISAVLIGTYAIFLIIYVLLHEPMSYAAWYGLFSHFFMKISTLIVLLSILWHTWIGIWTVLTDYVKNQAMRLFLETVVCLLLLAYLIWLLDILWVVIER